MGSTQSTGTSDVQMTALLIDCVYGCALGGGVSFCQREREEGEKGESPHHFASEMKCVSISSASPRC